MHIPSSESQKVDVRTFEEDFEFSNLSKDFDTEKWLYVPCDYREYRYILGTKGKNPVICIGINPSTAEPDNLDNTLKSVERIAHNNGFDSFIMFNVYAQRATKPNDMDMECNMLMHGENMKAFDYILSISEKPTIWAAWGTIINQRPYLKDCVRDMIALGEKRGATWVNAGKLLKAGHPHHPLYMSKASTFDEFDVKTYIDNL